MNSIGKIGVIMPEITDPLDYEFLSGVCGEASFLGYDTVIYTGIFNSQSEFQQDSCTEGLENIYSLVCKNKPDGIIFAAERFHNEQLVSKILSYLSQTDTPSLLLGYKHSGFKHINAEQHDASYNITMHLIKEHGCRNLLCIAGVPDHEPSIERLQGFKDAMNDSGLNTDNNIFYGWYWRDVPCQIAHDIADGKIPFPDGVVCLSDTMAIAFCDELSKLGIAVPEKIKVTGYDGSWHSAIHSPMITTVSGRDKQLGETAVGKLYEMMTGRKTGNGSCKQFIRYGTSCGCGYDKCSAPDGVWYSVRNFVSAHLQRSFDKKTFIATDFINRFTNVSDLEGLINEVDNVGHIIKGWKWLEICLCEDWCGDFDNPGSYRQHSYPDRMYLALSKRFGDNEKNGYYFPTADILPALSKPHEPSVIVLTSLHCNGMMFGYCAVRADSTETIDIDEHYVNWCSAISNGLYVLRRKLYIDYIHRQMKMLSTSDPASELPNKRGFTERLPETLHRIRKNDSTPSVLFISWLDSTASSAYDTAVIIANPLKVLSAGRLCGRIDDKVFSVVLNSADESESFITRLEKDLAASLGDNSLVPKLLTGIYEAAGKKPSEIEKSFEEIFSVFNDKCMMEMNYYASYKEQIYKLRRDIMINPQTDRNIADISHELGISRSHLQRLYKEFFSASIKDDIITARINYAMQLLVHTDLRVHEIAEQCGYNNESHFMRQFKDKCGITALQYRSCNKSKIASAPD